MEGANTFVFVISRDSVESKVCRDEIDHAVLHNKRLVPIVRRDDFEMAKVHPTLCQHNWLFFRETDDFETGLTGLLRAIETDLEYVRAHTRFLERAIEWQEQKRNESFGLKGDDLRSAEAWLIQGETKEPKPTELQQNYIRASRSTEDATAEAKRILERAVAKAKRVSLLSLLGVGAAISVAAISIPASIQAQRQAAAARSQMQDAQKQKDALLIKSEQLDASLHQTQEQEKKAQQKVKVSQIQYQQAQQKEAAAQVQAIRAMQQATIAKATLEKVNQEKGQAEKARQQAETQSQLAQQKAQKAKKAAEQANLAKAEAWTAQQVALAQRDIAQKGTELERKGVALLRLPIEQYRTSDTLISALDLGRDVKHLVHRGTASKNSSPYHAIINPAMIELAFYDAA
ncbi:toll/interleukin-1 receptor domain-containing protein [Leptolyngbya boryana CZ1]|uniref:Toll/interleukin-1 receptor domain-containing protein n=1 Tax=Leptolyngbya boryana CZ1 TaxID=3060204 RepID=A0AA96X218_LEPBY|nr:toll/interleukin-1 receptor domain-containing protein [Leptolyngbya boryana]WNZ49243.1 toll/interleukin-1 receptor domain-containing protein [Leptolyngbya boryana CZ1]